MASPISLLAFTHEPVTFISALKGCSRWLTGIPKNLFCVGGFCPAKITALKTAAWSTRRSSISTVAVAFEDEGRPVTAGTGCEFVNWSIIILRLLLTLVLAPYLFSVPACALAIPVIGINQMKAMHQGQCMRRYSYQGVHSKHPLGACEYAGATLNGTKAGKSHTRLSWRLRKFQAEGDTFHHSAGNS